MILTFIYIIGTALLILGLCEFIFGIKLFCISPKKREQKDLIIYLDCYDCCAQIAGAVAKMNWYNNIYGRIFAITDNILDKNIEECKEILKYYKSNNVIFCKSHELIEMINQTE